MGAARRLSEQPAESRPALKLFDPDAELEARFDRWLEKTDEPISAAILAAVASLKAACETGGDKPEPRSDYLSVSQAADKYNLGTRTIYRMVEDGLPHVRAGKAIRIKPRDLERRLADSETILR